MDPAHSGAAGDSPTGELHEMHFTGTAVDPAEVRGDGFVLRASGTYVPVGDRLVPSELELELDGDASAPQVVARVEVREGMPRVVALRFDAVATSAEVRQTHLRDVKLDAMFTLLAAFAVRVVVLDDGPTVVETSLSQDGAVRPEALAAIQRMRARRRMTPAFLREVAETYRANLDSGPTKAVRHRYFLSERAASKYVQEARAAGFLPPTTPGRKKG